MNPELAKLHGLTDGDARAGRPIEEQTPLKAFLKIVAAAPALAMVAAVEAAAAQAVDPTPPVEAPSHVTAKTQADAALATGKATTDAPAKTQTQGAAWAIQQGAAAPASDDKAEDGRMDKEISAPVREGDRKR